MTTTMATKGQVVIPKKLRDEQVRAALDAKGIPLDQFASVIAATVVRKNLIVVTRNVKDFQQTSIKTLNPFEDEE